jgi:hypothetical protein
LRSPDGWKTASSIDEAADEPPFWNGRLRKIEHAH